MSDVVQSTSVAAALSRENVAKVVVDLFKSRDLNAPPTEAQKNMCAVLKQHLKYDITLPSGQTGVEAFIIKASTHSGDFQSEIIRRINNQYGLQPQETTQALQAALTASPSAQATVAPQIVPAPQAAPIQTAAVPALSHEQASEALLGYLQKNTAKISALSSESWKELKADPIFQAVEKSIKTGLGSYASYADFSNPQKTVETLAGFNTYQSMIPAPSQLLAEVAVSDLQALQKTLGKHLS